MTENNAPAAQSPIIFAFQIPPTGQAIDIMADGLTDSFEHPTWIHIDANHPDSEALVQSVAEDLDESSLQALFDRGSRPRVLPLGQKALISLRGVNLNDNADAEDMVAIRMWATERALVSVRYRKLKTVLDIADRTREGNGPKDVGGLVTAICERLLERMEPVLTDLDDATDTLEEKVIDEPKATLRQDITEVRKMAIMFRRYIAPQKEAISRLRSSNLNWLDEENKRQLQESLDRVTRYVEDLDAIRERAQIVKDELSTVLSDRLNHNLYVLSVVTAIFLPLGALTGLFGINIGGMPGVENAAAFKFFVLFLIAVIAGQVAFFKWRRWF